MSVSYVLLGLLALGVHVLSTNPRDVKCLVCRKVVDEVGKAVDLVDPKKTVEVGSYRLDSQGNQKQKSIPYARSVVHLTDVLEIVCNKFDDYVKAKYKSSGELTIIKLVDENGKMNPEMGEVDILPDADLNKSLKFYCESIVEEYEDAIIKHFSNNEEDIDLKLCSSVANLCDMYPSEDSNYGDREEL